MKILHAFKVYKNINIILRVSNVAGVGKFG
jgi:hypothetical protein